MEATAQCSYKDDCFDSKLLNKGESLRYNALAIIYISWAFPSSKRAKIKVWILPNYDKKIVDDGYRHLGMAATYKSIDYDFL